MKELKCPLCVTGEYNDDTNFVYFGTYPQSRKAEDVTVGTATDENGYYTGDDGAKYAEVDGELFKVEPIKWRILQKQNGRALLLSELILDAKLFDVSKNNYAKSEIRDWLNAEFYKKAFGAAEKKRIVTTDVDNGLESTGDDKNLYICENTRDNVFLLSYREAFESYSLTNADRRKKVTPYAEKTGLYVDPYHHCGYWWLRSPYPDCDSRARTVHRLGYVNWSGVNYLIEGVVPALLINL